MEYTTNLNLKKPDINEYYNIVEQENENADIIDEAIGKLNSDVGTEELTTEAQDCKGAINELNKNIELIPVAFTFGELKEHNSLTVPDDITLENAIIITLEIKANNGVTYYGNNYDAYVYRDVYGWKHTQTNTQGVYTNAPAIVYFKKK